MNAFQWRNGQLAEQVSAYLRSLLGPDHGLVAHIQKAWPVVCTTGQAFWMWATRP